MKPFFDKLLATKPGTLSTEEFEKETKKLFGSGEMMSEPIFYGDSGAYDFQYLELIPKRYFKDKTWLVKNRDLDIDKLPDDLKKLKTLSEKKHYPTEKSILDFNSYCKFALNSFCFEVNDFEQLQINNAKALVTHFASIPGKSNQKYTIPGEYNETEAKPIIKIKNGLFFIPIFFYLTESAYISPFYWMLEDDKYRDFSFKNKGEALEQIAYEYFVKVFGSYNVYRDVQIIRRKGESITDIDVLAVAGNKAVVVQAKSKQMTEKAKIGNEKAMRSDFKKAVQSSYDQAIESRKALLTKGAVFRVNGKNVLLKEPLDDAYIVCLSSENYPAVVNQVKTYLKKNKKDPYPLAFSVFDLDIISFYLTDVYQLLYYLRQRVNTAEYFNANGEIGYLAFHLRSKLFKDPNADRIAIDDSFAQLIDANFISLKGGYPKTKAVEKLYNKWANADFTNLINQVKQSHNPGLTDAILFLFDLSGNSADKVIELIKKTKESAVKDGKSHDFSMTFDNSKSGITYICSSDKNQDNNTKKLLSYCTLRKYKSKADLWIGLCSSTISKNLVDQIIFNKEPWKSSKKLRLLANKLLLGGKGISAEKV
ncbi:hypothetical protein A2Y99_02120 [Candidatus Gottesmanbacteria bacterium RBG_13_37_7]|uniref:Uncharacterized protein n=1 Tax=Candidatus Gottesmanbacteria bacterium RBG_13_37_7 TaxID=1798369 RepID=A0A1F5YJV0_9BACT|nr:MAG: hypothetical protein A2Y99_02120 [Candidatus Gottesmanbacteria bacterium RBG_13_37_7]